MSVVQQPKDSYKYSKIDIFAGLAISSSKEHKEIFKDHVPIPFQENTSHEVIYTSRKVYASRYKTLQSNWRICSSKLIRKC